MDFGLYKRNKRWHYRFRLDGVKYRGTTRTTSKELAHAYVENLYIDAYHGQHSIIRNKVKVGDFVEEHLKLSESNLSTSWYQIKSHYLRAFLGYIRAETSIQYLKEIQLGHLKQYRHRLSESMQPKSVKNHITAISTMLNDALKLGYVKTNPVKRLDPIRGIRRDKKRYLSKDETRAVLDETKGTYFETFVRTAIYTGMRKSELINLEYDDVDIEKRLIHIRNKEGFLTKSRKERILPLHPKLMDIFNVSKKGYCFLQNGRRFHKDTVARDFRKVADRLGLQDVTIHSLRHTFISHCLMSGISMWEVSQWAGHSSSYITELYGHLCPDRREIDRLEI